MAHPAYLRAKARELRLTKHLSVDEIVERLALPKTTVYYWIKDLPLGRARRGSPYEGTRAMQAKYRRLREAAYEQGRTEYDELLGQPTFRDFVVLYIAEGFKRTRNRVSIGNSDPRMVEMATRLATPALVEATLLCRSVPRRPGSRKAPGLLGLAARDRRVCHSSAAEVQQRQARRSHLAI